MDLPITITTAAHSTKSIRNMAALVVTLWSNWIKLCSKTISYPFRRLLGHSSINFHHATLRTVPLRLRRTDPTTGQQTVHSIEFAKFVKSLKVPECNLSTWLFNGHLQTFWCILSPTNRAKVWYKRRVFHSPVSDAYAGTFAVDFVVKPYDTTTRSAATAPGAMPLPSRTRHFTEEEWETMEHGSLDSKPMLVLLHGLGGGSNELYLREAISGLVVNGDKHGVMHDGGWEAVVVNARGCGDHPITSGMIYSARSTYDIRQTVEWLREKFPNRPLFGMGFSLGANVLANYLGEEGDDCQMKAAILMSSPFNLEICTAALKRSFMGLNVYSRSLGGNMKYLSELNREQIMQNPNIDKDAARRIRFMHEFDRVIQCPTYGYPTEGAYYRDASSIDSIMAIRIPFLAISALDDPVCDEQALPFEEIKQTPYGILCTTSLGGHLGWFEAGGSRWYEKMVTQFFNTFATEMDPRKPFAKVHIPKAGASNWGTPSIEFEPMRRKLHQRSMMMRGGYPKR